MSGPGLARPVGPLRVSPDRRHLMDADGAPFFWLGDTAWELFHRLDREDAVRYLDDRAAKGFTVIQAAAHGRIYGPWSTAPNRYGDAPYHDGDPLRPNEAFFAHVDWVIERALERGIRTALLPVWAWTGVTSEPAVHAGNGEAYGRWIGARLREHGIIWVLGGDVAPIWYGSDVETRPDGTRRRRLVDYRPVYDALAAGIRATAGEDALFTYHPNASAPTETSMLVSGAFGDRPWFSFTMLQSSHAAPDPARVDEAGSFETDEFDREGLAPVRAWAGPYNYLPVAAEYRSEPARPVIDGEPCYEDHPRGYDAAVHGIWRPHHVRNAAYHALFAGAAGHTYGHVSLWDFYGSGGERDESSFGGFARPDWDAGLSAAGAGQMRHARSLLESRPWFDAVPDEELVVGDPGRGEEHVSAIRGADGSWAFVYLPQGGETTVDLGLLSGTGPVWWFDPRYGSATPAGEHEGSGHRAFSAPSAGRGEDWVLVLDHGARGYPPPGASDGTGVSS